MADHSGDDLGIGDVFVMTLVGLFVLGAGASMERARPPTLPPPEKLKLPPGFMAIPGQHRVIESQCLINDGRETRVVKVYEPPFVPAPWTLRAWYDPQRIAHVIDVTAHPLLRTPGAVSVNVFVGDQHRADRVAFKREKEPLWPDDKFENRVVHRVTEPTQEVCFLIEVTAYDQFVDFFHEPFVIDVPAPEDAVPKVKKRFAQLNEIEELERAYGFEREKLRERTDLTPAAKRVMEAHLIRLYEAGLQEVGAGE